MQNVMKRKKTYQATTEVNWTRRTIPLDIAKQWWKQWWRRRRKRGGWYYFCWKLSVGGYWQWYCHTIYTRSLPWSTWFEVRHVEALLKWSWMHDDHQRYVVRTIPPVTAKPKIISWLCSVLGEFGGIKWKYHRSGYGMVLWSYAFHEHISFSPWRLWRLF